MYNKNFVKDKLNAYDSSINLEEFLVELEYFNPSYMLKKYEGLFSTERTLRGFKEAYKIKNPKIFNYKLLENLVHIDILELESLIKYVKSSNKEELLISSKDMIKFVDFIANNSITEIKKIYNFMNRKNLEDFRKDFNIKPNISLIWSKKEFTQEHRKNLSKNKVKFYNSEEGLKHKEKFHCNTKVKKILQNNNLNITSSKDYNSNYGIRGKYKDYTFLSLEELKTIILLEKNLIKFNIPDSLECFEEKKYKPDFYLSNFNLYIEIKYNHSNFNINEEKLTGKEQLEKINYLRNHGYDIFIGSAFNLANYLEISYNITNDTIKENLDNIEWNEKSLMKNKFSRSLFSD